MYKHTHSYTNTHSVCVCAREKTASLKVANLTYGLLRVLEWPYDCEDLKVGGKVVSVIVLPIPTGLVVYKLEYKALLGFKRNSSHQDAVHMKRLCVPGLLSFLMAK